MNSKLIVPCDPNKYLTNQYPNWTTPIKKGFKWLNLDKKIKYFWNRTEMIKYF